MKRISIVWLLCICLLLLGTVGTVLAAEVDCDATYCFTGQDFSPEETLAGICITRLPDPETGTVMLGSRVLRAGDILTADQISQMTFSPLMTQEDTAATVSYLPIYENRVEKNTTMTISIRGKENLPPVAENMTIETYRNLPNTGNLKVSDPEGGKLTYTLIRAPKRGEVTICQDGSFTYTPKKNKVGVDSFIFTAADPAGNVSRQATVTVQILKPTDKTQYTDTVGLDCRFEAEWLKNTGLFSGERIGGERCFFPDKTVSRGDFLAMAVKTLDIPLENGDYSAIPSDIPMWLKPYVGAALRSGLLEGWPQTETGSWDMGAPITQPEAAVLLQNALDLSADETAVLSESLPQWCALSVAVMDLHGVSLTEDTALTRAQAAETLYKIRILAETAPGMEVLRIG